MKTAILGLGIIGRAWAENLRKDDVPLAVWNRTPKEFPGFEPDAAKAASGADMVIVVVADPPAVQGILERIVPVLRAGQILVQASTISAAWTRTFAAQVEKTGASFLEAPFTGSKPAAEARKTVFYLGGDAGVMERARLVLGRLSQTMMHIGPLGSASSLKLAMNANIAMVMEGLSESLRFARAEGVPDEVFFQALQVNVSRSGVSDLKEGKLKAGDYAPQFSLKHMDKDLRLALESAGSLELPQLRALKARYDQGMRKGLGDEDFSVLMRLL
ncbi:MAG TPA: NAD(P)-dependent oxidoreductase [Fibrobacteria bacterium]|nr:NAD(P)-dependent oxidoreductase [Fibrobacteria bacterium]